MAKYIIGIGLATVGGLLFFVGLGWLGIILICIGGFICFSSEYYKKIREENSQAQEQIYNTNKVGNCPNCNSNKTRKISSVGRVASVSTFGLASSTIGKQYICDECGHKW